GQGRFAEGHQDRERCEPALLRPDRASWPRCVGAFLLHRLPQQAPGLHHQLPRQPGELGIGGRWSLTQPLTCQKAAPCGAPFSVLRKVPPIMSDQARGIAAVLAASVLWGVFPAYFHLLKAVPAAELVSHRVVWTAAG